MSWNSTSLVRWCSLLHVLRSSVWAVERDSLKGGQEGQCVSLLSPIPGPGKAGKCLIKVPLCRPPELAPAWLGWSSYTNTSPCERHHPRYSAFPTWSLGWNIVLGLRFCLLWHPVARAPTPYSSPAGKLRPFTRGKSGAGSQFSFARVQLLKERFSDMFLKRLSVLMYGRRIGPL
jgi:hypothetical protein